jgi:hypothetical protein
VKEQIIINEDFDLLHSYYFHFPAHYGESVLGLVVMLQLHPEA